MHLFESEKFLRAYLLGTAPTQDQERIELRLLGEDGFAEQLMIAEEDLIDDYLGNLLNEAERTQFETYFLCTPQRQQKLIAARAFHRYLREAKTSAENTDDVARAATAQVLEFPQREVQPGRLSYWPPTQTPVWMRLAASLVLTGALGFVCWKIWYGAKPDEMLAKLNQEYGLRRQSDSRISELAYAPKQAVSTTTRGTDDKSNDLLQRNLLLLEAEALDTNGSAAVRLKAYHSLGRIWLIRRDFKKAEQFLTEASKIGGSNAEKAQLFNDLGALYLDQASTAEKADVQLLAQARGKITEALQLNNSLREALFNRAVVSELQMLDSTEADWEAYLKVDSTSEWAGEARDRLEKFRQKKRQRSEFREKAADKFQAALKVHDEAEAWRVFSGNRDRVRHSVSETLITEYLQLTAENRLTEAAQRLDSLTAAGRLEKEHSRDKYTTDVARFYRIATKDQLGLVRAAWEFLRQARTKLDSNQYSDAILLCEQAERKFRQAGDEPERLFAQLLKGHSYLRKQDIDLSLMIFSPMEQLCREKKYLWLLSHTLGSIADAGTTTGKWDQSRRQMAEAREIAEEIDDPIGQIRLIAAQISLEDRFQADDKIFALATDELEIYQHHPAPERQIWTFYFVMARVFLRKNYFHTAESWLQQSLNFARQDGLPLMITFSHRRFADFFKAKAEPDLAQAFEHFEMAGREAEKIPLEKDRLSQTPFILLDQADIRQQMGRHQEAMELYREAQDQFHKNNNFYQSYLCRKGRIRSLMQMGRYQEASADLEYARQNLEIHRQRTPEERDKVAFFDLENDFYELAAEHAWHEGKYDKAFDLTESSRARALLDALHVHPLSLSEVQREIPDDNVRIVEYTVLPQTLLIWVVSKTGIQRQSVPVTEHSLTKKVDRFRELVSSDPAQADRAGNEMQAFQQLASELYRDLLQPIRQYLGQQKLLCIVPDKKLYDLPFASLMPESGKYLMDDYALTVSPSASFFITSLKLSQSKGKPTRESVLVAGNPAFDKREFSNLSDLPDAAREARAIAALYKGAELLIGDQVTEKQFQRRAMQSDVIHFSGHASLDVHSGSVLLLTPGAEAKKDTATDGKLEAAEINRIKMPRTRLVVLAACSTGVGRNYRGEGAMHLARPFLANKIPLVIASLWPVDSIGSADLMIRFHQYRTEECLPETEALRKAQMDLRRDLRFAHPRFWAAFISIGAST
jgi:CHAT domain-containing protein